MKKLVRILMAARVVASPMLYGEDGCCGEGEALRSERGRGGFSEFFWEHTVSHYSEKVILCLMLLRS